ncbi:tigger transposable element-derived protein 6-like [Gigantopelta aegis]|uniref:tigger transposable element-derived protein 6-like n=1 Tax=Gigantopelta aegis TaxID=1735272 RepID=UPI001B88BBE5|nr:tigger transposable element-derived protein 6-like [Gigantopelta aegis]
MTERPTKRRRVELSLDDKLKIIKSFESVPKPTLRSLSEKFSIGKSTVGDIIKKREVYKAEFEKNISGNKRRFNNACKFDKLNELVWQWFCQAHAKNIPISGPIIQEKASEFAKELAVADFKGSNGWLDRWKCRYSVKCFQVSGESAGVDVAVVEDYKARIPDVVSGYAPKDVFNSDETGLYFRALPTKTLSVKGESSKERVTVMFACSATGEKLKALVIGKSQKPRCFKNVNVDIHVTYVANKKAWMTIALFTGWITSVNKIMRQQKRKIIMLLDNATSHGPNLELSNVTLKYLPANTTSHLQPLDQGIIRAFKARYRRHMLRYLVTRIDVVGNASDLCKQLTLLDAIHWISQAWNEMKPNMISKCFSVAGFSPTDESVLEDDDDDDIPLSRLARELVTADVDTDILTSFDDDVPIEDCTNEWERELVANFRGDEIPNDGSDNESEQDVSVPGNDLSYPDVLNMLQILKGLCNTER